MLQAMIASFKGDENELVEILEVLID